MAATGSYRSSRSISSATHRTWSWSRAFHARQIVGTANARRLAAPALLPHLLADRAGYAGLLLGNANDVARRLASGDLQHQLGADCFLELFLALDRDHERARTADHAILVVPVEILDIHGRVGRLLHHDRQPVDRYALLQRRLARYLNRLAVVVGAVA